MLIQVIRSGISVLLHDPSWFSMPGFLSHAFRKRAFYTNFLSFLTYNIYYVDQIVLLLLIAKSIY